MTAAERPSCKTCLFFHKSGAVYACRRYPPRLMLWTPSEPGYGTIRQSVWPNVGPGDFCGEHSHFDKQERTDDMETKSMEHG
jgi:hypothetical protein